MNGEKTRAFFFGTDTGFVCVLAQMLGEEFEVRHSDRFHLARSAEQEAWWEVILLDVRSATEEKDIVDALALMEELGELRVAPPVVAMLGGDERALMLRFMERGAYDTLESPPDIQELRLTLRRAAKFYRAQVELERLRAEERRTGQLCELIGTSPAMQEVFSLVRKIAPCDVTVLITGETGTGKELLARAIHRHSPRVARPFVAFSCANLPETLVEAELFGHERGAFTGAIMSRRGRLEVADHGTLFLDEVGDLSPSLQPKLLRVLQERTLERLGSNHAVTVNLRVICATNQSLEELVEQSKFREDLYYRLNVVQIHLPPLRERRDDIPYLATAFLQRFAEQFGKKVRRFSRTALRALEESPWPGNVRQLENVVQRAVALSDAETIELWDLPKSLQTETGTAPLEHSYEEEVRNFKRRLILQTLREYDWHKAKSARSLGVARGYLHRLINQLQIREEDDPTRFAKPEPSKQVM